MGWKEVYEKIDVFVDKWPGSDFGPAHILLSDQNTENGHVLFCLRETWAELKTKPDHRTTEELLATMDFLLELSEIDEEDRVEPERYTEVESDE